MAIQAAKQRDRLVAEGRETATEEAPGEPARRTLPRAEQRAEHRFVQVQKFDVLEVPLRVPPGCGHEFLGLADVETALPQDSSNHRRAGAVHPSNCDGLRLSTSVHSHERIPKPNR